MKFIDSSLFSHFYTLFISDHRKLDKFYQKIILILNLFTKQQKPSFLETTTLNKITNSIFREFPFV